MTGLRRFIVTRAKPIVWLSMAAWIGSIAYALSAGARPRPSWLLAIAVLFFGTATLVTWARAQRERAVREGPLPQFLKRKLREAHPQLDGRDCDLVERGFRQYFLACVRSNGKFVAMPSKAVDAYWHEFILHTRAYAAWCDLALGRFLHHTPAEALGASASDNDGLRRAWFWSCREESIQPRKPSRLPLLFALDRKLAIAGGFIYVTDCQGVPERLGIGAMPGSSGVHCAGDFGDGGIAGDAEGMGGADTSSDGSGDGGGDGGGGCGGD